VINNYTINKLSQAGLQKNELTGERMKKVDNKELSKNNQQTACSVNLHTSKNLQARTNVPYQRTPN
jgi:hypothetical protein